MNANANEITKCQRVKHSRGAAIFLRCTCIVLVSTKTIQLFALYCVHAQATEIRLLFGLCSATNKHALKGNEAHLSIYTCGFQVHNVEWMPLRRKIIRVI